MAHQNNLEAFRGKRLVVFGCGYVGTAVAQEARALGMAVEALTRNPHRAKALAEIGTRTVVSDLETDSWHEHIEPGPEFVLNCVSSGRGEADAYRRSYVAGMRSILEWAERGSVGTLAYTSSTSVYPQGGGATVDENSPTEGVGGNGRILREAEALLENSGPTVGRWFVLRLAGIYGPGRHHLLDQIRSGVAELAGTGGQHLNLAHRDDIVAAIWAVVRSPPTMRNRIFNVADDASATKAEVVEWLAAQVGRPPPRFSDCPTSPHRGLAAPLDRLISNARLKSDVDWWPKHPSFREGYRQILGG